MHYEFSLTRCLQPQHASDEELEELEAAAAADEDEDAGEKKSLREKLATVQEITAQIQSVMGEIASMGDRVRQ